MKKIDEVIREIIRKHNDIIKVNEENGGNKELNYFLDGEIVKQEISQYRDELLDELEEEFDNQRRYHTNSGEEIAPIDSFKDGYNACIDDSKQKILEMKKCKNCYWFLSVEEK